MRTLWVPSLGSLVLLAVLACDHENEVPEGPAVDPIIAPLLTAKNLGPPPVIAPLGSGSAGAEPSVARPVALSPPPISNARRRDLGADAALASGPTCGAPPLPDCPLARWMKEHTVIPVLAPDFPDLAEAFRTIATFAPAEPGYPYWKSISLDGAAAAEVYDIEAVHAGCRGCHTQYRAKYIAEIRARSVAE